MATLCDGQYFEDQIINILCNNGIFTGNTKINDLETIYKWLRGNYNNNHLPYKTYSYPLNPNSLDIDSSIFIDNLFSTNPIIGHDLPIWLTPDNEEEEEEEKEINLNNYKRVMFISQDPRRSIFEIKNSGTPRSTNQDTIIFSSPFGVHSQDYSSYDKQGLFARVAKKLSNSKKDGKGIMVYMTDLYKFRAANNNKNDNLDKPNTIRYHNVLGKEINAFEPDLIVLISSTIAENWLNIQNDWLTPTSLTQRNGKKYKVMPVYHTAIRGDMASLLNKTTLLNKTLRLSLTVPTKWCQVEYLYYKTIYKEIP